MKKFFALIVLVVLSVSTMTAKAQVTTGVDLYSSYIWRGMDCGGPSFQPYVDYTTGGFSIGAWGSTNFDASLIEMDLYAGYSFDFGLGITVTDYYFGGDWTDFDSLHTIEPMITYGVGSLSLTGAYMIGSDAYVEAAYSFESFDLFVGAGNGAYTDDGDFMICNIGVSTSKEIEITDKFSLPVSGSAILNPTTGGFYIVVGISL